MKTCIQCHKEITGKRSDATYCSQSCIRKAEYIRSGGYKGPTWTDPDYHRKWREQNRDKWNAYSKNWHDKVREECLVAYGNKCSCCGESESVFLTIDHINNDGQEHRKTFTGPIHRILKEQGFPDDYQILCWNCQWGKRMGNCPHNINLLSINSGG